MATNSESPGGDAEMTEETTDQSKCTSTLSPDSLEQDVRQSKNSTTSTTNQSESSMDTASQEENNETNSQTNSAETQDSETVSEDFPEVSENNKKHKGSTEESAMEVDLSAETERVSGDGEESEAVMKPKETVDFKLMFNKQKYDVNFDLDATVASLKMHVQTVTGVPTGMQKLMYRGLMKDDKTLRELNVTKGIKMMLIGSTINDVLGVNKPVAKGATGKQKEDAAPTKEPLCKQKMHKKILDKGKPEDIMPGTKGRNDSLPVVPISGMYNKAGGKVRLTFKLEIDQLWIGTKERTEKLPMSSIKNVISEPIEDNEDFHIMAIQLGPTEQSRYWLYWVPAQYTNAIKDAILFKWQYF